MYECQVNQNHIVEKYIGGKENIVFANEFEIKKHSDLITINYLKVSK